MGKTAAWSAVGLEVQYEFLSTEMAEYGFPGCIGIGDGLCIKLTGKPHENPYIYWCETDEWSLSDV